MSIDNRSNAQVLVSMAAGLAFTTAAVALSAFLLYCFGDELFRLPTVRLINLGIVAVAMMVVVYWALAGLGWLAEDLAEVMQRLGQRRSA
jgi:hypothetical protein